MSTLQTAVSPDENGTVSFAWRIGALLIVVLLVAWFAVDRYQRAAPRRSAVAALVELHRSLAATDATSVLQRIVLPASAANRTPAEQAQWLGEVLRDEISDAGIDALSRHARFGPLATVFPEDGPRWAESAQVPVGECVAFRMERDGIRAEVVLHQTPDGFRILRCNNVKQMAPASKS